MYVGQRREPPGQSFPGARTAGVQIPTVHTAGEPHPGPCTHEDTPGHTVDIAPEGLRTTGQVR